MRRLYKDPLKLVFLLGLIVIPVFYWPYAQIWYEVPKVFFVNRWIEILILIFLFTFRKRKINKNIDKSVFIIIFVYLFIALISSLFGSDLIKSFIGNYYRHEGLITLFHLTALALVISSVWKDTWKEDFAKAISLGVLTCCALILTGKTSAGGFGNIVFAIGYLSVTLPFTVSLVSIKKPLSIWNIAVILQLIVILKSGVLAGYLILMIFLISLLVINKKSIKPFLLLLSGLLAALFLMVNLYIRNFLIEKKLHTFMPESRERIFMKGFKAFLDKPIFGWGYANFDYAADSIDWPLKVANDIYIDKAHSSILENVVTTGIFGIISYLFIIIKTFTNLFKKSSYMFFVLSFVLVIIHSQTNVTSIAEDAIFWIIVGVGMIKPAGFDFKEK